MVSEQPQAKGVQVFKDKRVYVSYPSRAATMPLVFFTTSNRNGHVISKDRKIRKKGFACLYDHLTNEPVILLSHDADMRKISTNIKAPQWILGNDRPRIEVVKERCVDLEKYLSLIPFNNKHKVHKDWIDNLKVVTLHGMHWTGYIYNTYDQMGEQLEWISQMLDGKQILVFLPAWMDATKCQLP